MQARFLMVFAAATMLAACASTPAEEYPSLAIRDAERWSGTLPVEPYTPPSPAPATIASVEELAADARAAHTGFLAAAPRARANVVAARGSAAGSEAWSNAQVALAELESRRSTTMIALAELDRIYVETSSRGEAIAPVEAVHEQISALVEQQDAVIDELAAALR